MRRTAPLLLLLVAPFAAAQTTVPDTLAPERYAPLGLGDRWEYQRDGGPAPGPTYLRRTVVGDTTIDGDQWAVQREQGFRPTFYPDDSRTVWTRTEDVRRYYRFDADLANVVERDDGAVSPVYRCRLDLPVPVPQDGGGGVRLCSDPEVRLSSFTSDPSYSKTVRVGEDGTVEASIVFSESFFSGPELALDVGEVRGVSGEGPVEFVLAYADVGDETRGEPIEGMPYVPDPTPPASYYPLGVGDEWIYSQNNAAFRGYTRRTVVRDSIVEGRAYAVVESTLYDLRADVPSWSRPRQRLLRFDSTTTNVMELGSEVEVVAISNLGEDFLACPTPADGGRCPPFYDYASYPGELVPVMIGEEVVLVPSVKFRRGGTEDVRYPGLAAGIGQIQGNDQGDRFEYARVGDVEYGSHPVATTDRPAPPAFTVTAGPNPTAGLVTLALDLPAPADVAVEAFDVLGRRVWRATAPLGAGRQTVALDAGAWAPGLYVVRVTAGGAARAVRVVRR